MALLNLLLFGDVLFGGAGKILSSPGTDVFLHFAAWRQFAFDQLQQGHLVLWNPHYLCGAPFLGNFESALLYPPNWLFMILPLAAAINWGIVLHVFLAGFFTYLLAAWRGLQPLACLMAGTVFMFGGAYFLHVSAGHLPNLCAMVWAPLIFLALDGLFGEVSLRWILLGVFGVSMQILAGHPQYVYFTAIMALVYTSLNLKENKDKAKIAGGFVSIYAGASLLTAVQLWTGVQALAECGRTLPMEYKSAASFSFPPENLLTLVLPGFFGTLTSSPYWGRWFLWEVSLFIGITTFFLVGMAVLGRDPKERHWGVTMVLISFIFALGAFTPLYHFFYGYVPGFQGLRGICKFAFLTSLFLAMLAALGLDRLLKSRETLRWPAFPAAGIGIAFLLTGLAVGISVQSGINGKWAGWFTSVHWLQGTFGDPELGIKSAPVQEFIRKAGQKAAFSLVVGGAICLVVAFLFWIQKRWRGAVYALAALSVLELLFFARTNRPTFEESLLQKKYGQIRDIYAKDPGDYRIYGTGAESLAAGGYDIWEDEPMVLGRYGRFVCASQGLRENQLFSVLPIFKKFSKIFGLVRLKYLVSTGANQPAVYTLPFKRLARMQLVGRWEVIPDGPGELKTLLDPLFDPNQKVVLENDPALPAASGKTMGRVEWRDLSTEETEIKAEAPHACLLLITDNYSSGWKALPFPDSGQQQYRVMPGDYFLRAIPLKAGKHHFRLKYETWAFEVGKWVSGVSLGVFFFLMLAAFRKRPAVLRV